MTWFMFVGWSMQDLYWYDNDGRRKSRRRIIDSAKGRSAYGCKACGVITIDTTGKQTPARRGKSMRDRLRGRQLPDE